jgi:hypothetical protein
MSRQFFIVILLVLMILSLINLVQLNAGGALLWSKWTPPSSSHHTDVNATIEPSQYEEEIPSHQDDNSSSLEFKIMEVLKSEISTLVAKDFAQDTYTNPLLFPSVGMMRGGGVVDCPVISPNIVMNKTEVIREWETLTNYKQRKQRKRGGEFFQEVGFIQMLRAYYPRTFTIVYDEETLTRLGFYLNDTIQKPLLLENLHTVSPVRVFLPICGYFVGHGSFGSTPLKYIHDAMTKLQMQLGTKKIFYVSPHPGTQPSGWEALANNARSLKIDQSTRGFFNDIIIPVSTLPSTCDYNSTQHQIERENLVYSCGADHSKIYKGLRSRIPYIFNMLNKTGVDTKLQRTQQEYDLGFYKSKFCFVVPGDTTGTSQSSRAMCAGCVPIFLAMDFRDLPFSNILDYSSFSIRIHSHYFFSNNTSIDYKRALWLYEELSEMVVNGTYDKLRRNVEVARDFFNYHRFGSRSPYGAAFVSMFQDELTEMKI